MNYEELLDTADQLDLAVKEQPLTVHDGLIRGRRIAIRKSIETQAEKSCVLAEELGHYFTSFGNILNMDEIQNRKQELRARLSGYDMQIGLIGIVECYKHHCRSLYEMAEYLQVTEEYLKEALECYSRKYGENLVTIDNYAIRFVPSLQVIEFWK
ncbi:hypothetical protein [Fusicatenibacter saccharivorans]|uniref:hypothetical protein n=1 Tax=Fusicatenibacter saccharivorans TaxID=1150298 RepID=UPI003F906AFE